MISCRFERDAAIQKPMMGVIGALLQTIFGTHFLLQIHQFSGQKVDLLTFDLFIYWIAEISKFSELGWPRNSSLKLEFAECLRKQNKKSATQLAVDAEGHDGKIQSIQNELPSVLFVAMMISYFSFHTNTHFINRNPMSNCIDFAEIIICNFVGRQQLPKTHSGAQNNNFWLSRETILAKYVRLSQTRKFWFASKPKWNFSCSFILFCIVIIWYDREQRGLWN